MGKLKLYEHAAAKIQLLLNQLTSLQFSSTLDPAFIEPVNLSQIFFNI